MTAKRFNIEFDGHQYFLVIDEVNERCLAKLDTRIDALAWLEMYKMLSEENERLKTDNGAFIQDIEVFKEENTHLKLENDQLKQFIDDLTTKGTGKIDLANGYSYNIKAILTDYKW